MALKELSDGGPDGTRLGQSASDLIAFHGKTPTDMCATIAAVATGSTIATVETAVQAIIAVLKEKGLCGS